MVGLGSGVEAVVVLQSDQVELKFTTLDQLTAHLKGFNRTRWN